MAKELPLNPLWQSLGASFKEVMAWRIPMVFKGVESECDTVRTKAGLIDYSYFGKIQLSGKDSVQFLHNILTNDIKKLNPGEGCPAALLTAPGKVLSYMKVYRETAGLLLEVEMNQEEKTAQLLNKYVIMEDVEIKTVTHDISQLSLQGPLSGSLLNALFPAVSLPQKSFNHIQIYFEGAEIMLINQSSSKEMRFDLLIPNTAAEALAKKILSYGKKLGVEPAGYESAETLRIAAGILRYGLDFNENTFLPETDLDILCVSETKGCYPGQEAVARYRTYKRPIQPRFLLL